MSILSAITGAVGGIVKPIAGVLNAKTQRRQSAEEGKNKVLLAKQDGENSLDLTDAEWEAISAAGNTESWKDEYVTIICTLPYVAIFFGAVIAAFGNPLLLSGAMEGAAKLNEIGIDVGHLCQVVVYAAVGLKLWRGR